MKNEEWAEQIWQLLIQAARDRDIYTYGEIAKKAGCGAPIGVGSKLDPIFWFCLDRGWPYLTILVVSKDPRIPSQKFWEDSGLDRSEFEPECERVFAFDWFAVEPPEAEDFRRAIKHHR